MEEQIIFYRSMIDFGLVILIWTVQLIIYPGFEFSEKSSFPGWHKKYMWLVTFIVAPLMLFQVSIILYQVLHFPGITYWVSLIFAGSLWLHTFLKAVPVHNQLNRDGNTVELVRRLVRLNWYRTIIWTFIWLIGLYPLLF